MASGKDKLNIAGPCREQIRDLLLSTEPAQFSDILERSASTQSIGNDPALSLNATSGAVWFARETRAGEISAADMTRSVIERIRRFDDQIRSFITVDAKRALESAAALDQEATTNQWRGRPLHGASIAFKDIFRVDGCSTSCGTADPDYFGHGQEATVVSRLKSAGAISLGKLNMSELAVGPFGDNSHYGDVRNPWNLACCAGGSSSGSAAAVAAGLALGTLGSDTGGSIRVPAACCGVVGLKPTYSRVSRAGAMPLSWSLDHVGPIARTVRDVAVLLQIIAGHDRLDPTSSRVPVPDYGAALERTISGIRIGVPANYFFEHIDPEIEVGVRDSVRVFRKLGADVRDIYLPDLELLTGIANLISRCESAAIHWERLSRQPNGLQPSARSRFERGRQVSTYDYLEALRLRISASSKFISQVFSKVDALITPVIPEPAPIRADVIAGTAETVTSRVLQFTRLCRPFNALGLPALSVPCGFSSQGLPLAFQLIGRPFDEATVLQLGHAFEKARPSASVSPPEFGSICSL